MASEFDAVRNRKKQGADARARVLARASNPNLVGGNAESEFAAVRNRTADISPPTLLDNVTNTVKNTLNNPAVRDFANKGLNYAGQEMQRQAANREKNRLKLPPALIIGPGYIENSTFARAAMGDPKAIKTYKQYTGVDVSPTSEYDQRMQEIKNTVAKNPYLKPLQPLAEWGTGIMSNTDTGNFINRAFGTGGGMVVGDKPYYNTTTGNATADKIADYAGNVGGVFGLAFNPAAPGVKGQNLLTGPLEAAEGVLATRAGNALTNTISRQAARIPGVSAGTADRFTRGALSGAAAGAIGNTAIGINQDQTSGQEMLHNAGLGAAFGAGGDLLIRGAGAAGRAALGRGRGNTATQSADTLALPLGRGDQRMAQAGQRSSLARGDDAIVNPTDWAPEPLGLPAGRNSTFVGEAPTPLQRVGARPGASREPVQRVNESSINRQQNFNINDPSVPEFMRVRQARIDAANAKLNAVNEPPINRVSDITEAPGGSRLNERQAQIINQDGSVERGFASTLRQSEKTPAEFSERLDSTYRPITNAETVQQANRRLTQDVNEATNYVLGESRFTAEKAATAQRLIDHYNQQKNYEMAVNVANKVAEEATNAGQSIQALSLFERLTPEGVLVRAQKLANSVNEKLPTKAEKVKITDDMAAKMTDLAETTQRMTGVKGLANDVVDILKRAKAGEKLNDVELDQLSRFIKESKQFVKESSRKVKPTPPRRPPAMKDKRVRDNVVKFLDAQEAAARERLRARGIQISSLPLDVWADQAIVGAAKMAKNVVKFSEWSEEMVKEFGEGIRPALEGLYARSKEAFELSAKKVSQNTISQAEKLTEKVIREKNLTDNEAESLLVLARKVSGLSGDAKRIASQDLQVILQSLDKPGFWKKVSSAQTMAQLLNPKTQVRNVLGNELFYRVERLNKILATPIDMLRSKITGKERYVTFRTHNQGQFWKSWMEGAKAGWKGININGLQTQYDLNGQAFKGKYNPLTYLEKTLGASLRGFDNAAYMRAYNDTLGEMATLEAINKGIKPTREYVQDYINRADQNILEIADQYGKYVTFQDKNAISRTLSGAKKALNFNKDFGIGDLVIKYPNTPGALLMRALEYSPAGFMRSANILMKGLRYGESNPREMMLSLSRAIVGTFGMTGMGYFLMDKGIITGEASKDKDIRALQQSAGQGQYQVNLSALRRFVESGFNSDVKLEEGDLLYTYDWMQPVSIAISMGANINKNVKDEKEADEGPVLGTLAAGYNSFAGGINTLQQQSVLKGLANAASGYAGQTATDKIVDVLSDIPSSFIPTILNQIKQTQDNSKRETYSPNKLEQSINKAQAKIPGLAEMLPKKYDTLGQEQRNYQDPSLTNIFLNPGFPSRYKLSPEAQEVVNLITETEDETLAPRVPGKTLKGNKLTGEQFSRLSQVQGEETARRIRNLSGTTEQKAKQMEKSLKKASENARKQIMQEFNLSAK
ncbi:hypothetical protein [Paenibacillus maysiensis]|uniref:hypothetical protein n=1 Tax=Paenibacillus maysiensis TaxID=1155954 RepID=UPI0004712883|nr:hypothetical protein [Paenibacillus maysiensis]